MDSKYWLITWEQQRNGSTYKHTEVFDEGPASFLATWNSRSKTDKNWFPLTLIFAMTISKAEYDELNT